MGTAWSFLKITKIRMAIRSNNLTLRFHSEEKEFNLSVDTKLQLSKKVSVKKNKFRLIR